MAESEHAATDVEGPPIEDLQERVDELDAAEEVTARDLEAFRRTLPTDPERALLVDRWLPYPWGELFEYVQGSGKQSPYWRTRPPREKARSAADLQHKEQFREAASRARGVRGTVERDGRKIPAAAAVIGDHMQGRRFPGERLARSGRRALSKLRALLGD